MPDAVMTCSIAWGISKNNATAKTANIVDTRIPCRSGAWDAYGIKVGAVSIV